MEPISVEPKPPKDPNFDRVKNAVAMLSEHYDCVQIFVSNHDTARSGNIQADWGHGNYHARYGQVREWIVYQDEITRDKARPTE